MLVDFATTVPAPLTAALVPYAPLLAVVRSVLQIISWRSSWYDSWLAVAAWWALCLLSEYTLRYLLPLLLAVVLCIPFSSQLPPATEKSLDNTIADLIIINTFLPKTPPVPPPPTLLRIAAVVYIPYLLIVYLIPLRIILAILGTVVLTARAPFTALIISTLSRSAYLRHAYRLLFSLLTGAPLPITILSHQPTPTSPLPVPALRFLFTIHENQRWWMGLDWTAALLPGERPSWCSPSPSQAPVSPPNAFTLPSPTTIFLPDGAGRRVKRTATWRWEEPEWRVVVRREGGALSRVERPIPEEHPEPTHETTGSRLLKAAGKMRESTMSGNSTAASPAPQNPGVEDIHEDVYEEDHVVTDIDGWVYGDNKWEGASSKGGMGKYTRYRRWTRVAVVSEMVQIVDNGPIGVDRPDAPVAPQKELSHAPEVIPHPSKEVYAVGTITGSPPDEESPLRQRLRRALSKSTSDHHM
ncbi:hypothetical protein C0991_011028 [Blastosporella zonata]|nr:hypothetical protein C0991_011028 [Blastosporella zonata]